MLTDKISEIDLTKYNTSSKICRIVMEELFSKIYKEDTLDVYELEKYSDQRIEEECQKIYKKEKNKGVAFPTSISLNNCAGNYRYEKENDNYNTIKEGDIIKIELGASISGCIGVLGETIIKLNKKDNEDGKYDDDKKIKDNIKYIQLLNDLKDDVIDMIKVGEINDEIRIHVESKCIENKCFPLQNTVSYQHVNGELNGDESIARTKLSPFKIMGKGKKHSLNIYAVALAVHGVHNVQEKVTVPNKVGLKDTSSIYGLIQEGLRKSELVESGKMRLGDFFIN